MCVIRNSVPSLMIFIVIADKESEPTSEPTSPVVTSPVVAAKAKSPVVVEKASPVVVAKAKSPVVVEKASPVVAAKVKSPVVAAKPPVVPRKTKTDPKLADKRTKEQDLTSGTGKKRTAAGQFLILMSFLLIK